MTLSSLRVGVAPSGLIVERHEIGAEGLIVHARGARPATVCPACGSPSSSVHSRYTRSLTDLPAHGRRLTIKLTARRFRCRVTTCNRKIFTERFAHNTIAAHARRTSRLDLLTHGIALVLSGRPGERLTGRLSIPVSADTLLRILRRRATPPPTCVKVVGIDDFAWRKGQRYGVARQSELERTSIRTGKCSRGEAMIDAARQERKGVYCRRASIRIMI